MGRQDPGEGNRPHRLLRFYPNRSVWLRVFAWREHDRQHHRHCRMMDGETVRPRWHVVNHPCVLPPNHMGLAPGPTGCICLFCHYPAKDVVQEGAYGR